MSFTVKQARVFKGKTQREMAMVLRVSEQTYRKYERRAGAMPSEMLVRFSKALNIPINQITIMREEDTDGDQLVQETV